MLELLTTLLVIAVVFAIGAPGLGQMVREAAQTADINAFVSAVQLARSESAKRGVAVRVCPARDGVDCLGSGDDFSDGWIVRLDTPPDAAAAGDPGAAVLFSHDTRMQGTIHANRPAFLFRPYFRRSTNGTITFCDTRGAQAARSVIISYTGRPRVTRESSGGGPLQCPGID